MATAISSDFVERISQQLGLLPIEIAVLRSSGVQSFEDIDSLLRNFPSIENAGVRVPRLSSAVVRQTGAHFSALAANISKPLTRPVLGFGAAHPKGAQSAPGTRVPIPPASAGSAPPPPPPGASAAGKIDLRPPNWRVRNQGSRGTCVAFATTACVEHYIGSPGVPPDLSEQFLYCTIKTKTSDPRKNADGTLLEYARDALSAYGICDESLWPYVGASIAGNISQAGGGNPSAPATAAAASHCYTAGSYQIFNASGSGAQAVLNLLQNGQPVAITLPVFTDPAVPNGPDNWGTASGWAYGRVLNPPPTAIATDGHAVCVVGYEPDPTEPTGGYFVFRNSWDVTWANQTPSPGNSYSPEADTETYQQPTSTTTYGNCFSSERTSPIRRRHGVVSCLKGPVPLEFCEMEPLKIKSIKSGIKPGDFGAIVDESALALELPEQIATTLQSQGVHTASELISYIEAFPSAIAARLKWTLPDVLSGLEALRGQLKGHVDDAVLSPTKRGPVSYGAMNPATYKSGAN
jgi:Papain family cysteine protease